jgi:UDP-N-acetylmuramate: L-alanyl-gamma-D-glutamyl-meso-diaminopimelate ligase
LHYFRKLPFEPAVFQKNNEQYVVASELGAIPVNFRDENVLLNLEGIKLLCQQFGVMEEEFYEAVMSFE